MHRRITIVLYIAVSIVSLGLALYYTTPVASAPATEAPRDVSASLSVGDILPGETHTILPGTSALAFLVDEADEHGIQIATKEYAGMGTLVEKIGELQNGTDDKYWMYYVNGAFALVGADAYIVQEGDSIEWKFEVPEEY